MAGCAPVMSSVFSGACLVACLFLVLCFILFRPVKATLRVSRPVDPEFCGWRRGWLAALRGQLLLKNRTQPFRRWEMPQQGQGLSTYSRGDPGGFLGARQTQKEVAAGKDRADLPLRGAGDGGQMLGEHGSLREACMASLCFSSSGPISDQRVTMSSMTCWPIT